MNKEVLHWMKHMKYAEIGMANPGGVLDKYWPFIFLANDELDERSILGQSFRKTSYGHKSRGNNQEVHLEDFGLITVKVNCCRKRHEISILPNGRMVLHAHQNDLGEREVFQALLGMSGQSEVRTRCEVIRDSYYTYMKRATNWQIANRDSYLEKLPKELQRVASSRTNLRKTIPYRHREVLKPADSDIRMTAEGHLRTRGDAWLKNLHACWYRSVGNNIPHGLCGMSDCLKFQSHSREDMQRFYKEVYKTRRFWTVYHFYNKTTKEHEHHRAVTLVRDPLFVEPPFRVLFFSPATTSHNVSGPQWGWEFPALVLANDAAASENKAEGAKNYGIRIDNKYELVPRSGWMITLEKPVL